MVKYTTEKSHKVLYYLDSRYAIFDTSRSSERGARFIKPRWKMSRPQFIDVDHVSLTDFQGGSAGVRKADMPVGDTETFHGFARSRELQRTNAKFRFSPRILFSASEAETSAAGAHLGVATHECGSFRRIGSVATDAMLHCRNSRSWNAQRCRINSRSR